MRRGSLKLFIIEQKCHGCLTAEEVNFMFERYGLCSV